MASNQTPRVAPSLQPHSSSSFTFSPRHTASASASVVSSSAPSPALGREPWEISADEVSISGDDLVGEGFFGVVYKARWRGLAVCAKRLKNVRGGELVNFTAEVNLCAQLRHPHLVQFLAACTTPGRLCILTEWMTGGSLHAWLHERTRVGGQHYSRHATDTLLRIGAEVATALVYLHAGRIVHRDLSSSNILLDEHLTAKISDFGLSRTTAAQAADATVSGAGGNLLYLAPEAFLLQQFTDASDIFAFGVVLNEMMTGQVPYSGVSPALAASECANRGARPHLASSTPLGVGRLICACWAHDPAQRPSAREVLHTLEVLRAELADERRLDAALTEPSSPHATSYTPLAASALSDQQRSVPMSAPSLKSPAVDLEYFTGDSAVPALAASSLSAGVSSSKARKGRTGGSSRSGGTATATDGAATISAPLPSPVAHAVDPLYNRAHTPDPDEQEAAPAAAAAAAAAGSSGVALISSVPSVSAKDVRLFLLLLKKHLPPHDALVLHKPQISRLDALCEGNSSTSRSSQMSKARYRGSGSDATTAGSAGDSGGHRGDMSLTSSLRSRSEGDTEAADADSLEGQPRPHACSPSFVSSMYPHRWPTVGELVICRTKRADDMGAQFDLLEYSQPPLVGLALMQELTKRKMRSISKLVTVGQLDVLRVLHVDTARGFVDLSKRDISDAVRSTCLFYWKQADAAHRAVLATAQALHTCSYCLYSHLIWPLAARFENSLFKTLRLALTSPCLVLGEYRECSCLQQGRQAAAATSAAATATSAASSPTFTLHLLTTPRVLPEIARRCSYHRVRLDLAGLALDAFPRQLLGQTQGGEAATETGAATAASNALAGGTTSEASESEAEHTDNSTANTITSGASTKSKRSKRDSSRRPSGATPNSSGGSLSSSDPKPLTSTLKSLSVENNPLRTLPDAIGSFRKLKELNLNSCALDDLPLALSQCANLRRLYAFGNAFQSVPVVVRQLCELEQLNLSANRIGCIESGELSGLAKLRHLAISHNRLAHLDPAVLPVSIQQLNLSNNAFRSFPEALFALPSLSSLEIQRNKIACIGAPPQMPQPSPSPPSLAVDGVASGAASAPLAFLEFLDASNNSLTSIADSVFDGCSYLSSINLSHNQLTKLPASLFAMVKQGQTTEPPAATAADAGTDVISTCISTGTGVTGASATSAPVGLTYLNIANNPPLKAGCVSVADWTNLANNVQQFVFDAASVPSSKAMAAAAAAAANAAASALAVPSSPLPSPSPTPSAAAAATAAAPLIHTWSSDQVATWLRAEGFDSFVASFTDNDVRGETLLELDKSDLRDLGVLKLGTQKQMLKLIQMHKDAMVAAQAQAQANAAAASGRGSQAPTPGTLSVQASPALQPCARPLIHPLGDLSLSALSLGARAVDGQNGVRRTHSALQLSPSTSFATASFGGASLSLAGASLANGAACDPSRQCDPRHCELIKSVLLGCALRSGELCKPVLLRCVVVLLIGQVFTVEDARSILQRTVQAGREGAAQFGGAISTPFSGLYGGCTRASLTISPLLEPLFALSVACLLPQDGTAVLEAATGAMAECLHREGKGGRVKIAVRPYVLDMPANATHSHAHSPAAADSDLPPPLHASVGSGASLPPPSAVPALLTRTSSGSGGGHLDGGELLAAWQAFRDAKRDEAAEREARRSRKKAQLQEQRKASDAGTTVNSAEKKKKRREGEKRSKEKNPSTSVPAGAFD